MAAKESRLALLHEKLTEAFLQMLEDPGEEGLKAAELTAIAKFLKDNNITCEIDKNPRLKELKDRVTDNVTRFPFNPAVER
jgi:hypothetical protein